MTNNFSLEEDADLINELKSEGENIKINIDYIKAKCPSSQNIDISGQFLEPNQINFLELFDMMIMDGFWELITTENNRYMHQQISMNSYLGDKIYQPSLYLIPPQQESSSKSYLNHRHASARCAIGRKFGVLKCKWGILRSRITIHNNKKKLDNIVIVLHVYLVLHSSS